MARTKMTQEDKLRKKIKTLRKRMSKTKSRQNKTKLRRQLFIENRKLYKQLVHKKKSPVRNKSVKRTTSAAAAASSSQKNYHQQRLNALTKALLDAKQQQNTALISNLRAQIHAEQKLLHSYLKANK